MAIDSREKRQSISGISVYFNLGVTPNASKDQEWRQEAGYGYPGVLTGGASVAVSTYIPTHRPRRRR